MITFKTKSYNVDGTDAEITTVHGKQSGKVVRDSEGHLEVITEEAVEDGAVIVVVRDGADSTYGGVIKDGQLIVGPVSLPIGQEEDSDD